MLVAAGAVKVRRKAHLQDGHVDLAALGAAVRSGPAASGRTRRYSAANAAHKPIGCRLQFGQTCSLPVTISATSTVAGHLSNMLCINMTTPTAKTWPTTVAVPVACCGIMQPLNLPPVPTRSKKGHAEGKQASLTCVGKDMAHISRNTLRKRPDQVRWLRIPGRHLRVLDFDIAVRCCC